MISEPKKLSETLGTYNPSFFLISLNTDESLGNLSKVYSCTAAHEYVHYMQDVATVYGLMNLCVEIEHIITIRNYLRQKKGKEVKVPIADHVDLITSVDYECVGKLWRSCQNDEPYEEIAECIEGEFTDANCYGQKYIDVTVANPRQRELMPFGAQAMMESQAHIIQELICGKENAPVVPYKMIEMLTEYVYPEFNKNQPISRLGLIDISFSSPNPAHVYYSNLLEMAKKNVKPEPPLSIYDILLAGKRINFNGRKLNSTELYYTMYVHACENINLLFDDESLESAKEWGLKLLGRASNVKLQDNAFWLTVLTDKDRVKAFNDLMKITGMPVIRNGNGEYSTYPGDVTTLESALNYTLLIHFVDIYVNGENPICILNSYCSSDEKMQRKMGWYCNKDTWKACDNVSCPLAKLWNALGISGVDVKYH